MRSRSATSWCATSWARSAAFPAWGGPLCSPPSARCASGSIRTSSSVTIAPPTMSPGRSRLRTPRWRPAVSVPSRVASRAVGLVFLVMFLFLQNIRYTIIPTIVVPVALLGTCVTLLLLGFSINLLTLFAMVLAIGILVDDAIVVVENVERIMSEEGLPPREATRKAMTQITGAIVGITLVLVAVFVPMAFFPGSVGVIYRQFSATMVSAIAFSALMALSLTPALSATLLKQVPRGHHH